MSKKTETVTMWDEDNGCMHTIEQPANWDSMEQFDQRNYIKRSLKGIASARENNESWRNWIRNRRGDNAEIHKSVRERTQASKDLRAYDHRREAEEYKSGTIASIAGMLFLAVGILVAAWVWVNIGAGAIVGCVVIFSIFLMLIIRIGR